MLSDKFLGGYLRDGQLSQIAELAISECGDLGRFQAFIREVFLPMQPTPAHKLLPKFVWYGLATTNYDLLIENGYAQTSDRLQEPRPMIEDRDRVDENLRDARNVVLLKLHGCITRVTSPACPLILTPDQYLEHRTGRSRLFNTLQEWGAEHPLVFVGHSVSDCDIRAILMELRELGDYRPRYFIVAPDADEIKKRFWETKRISLLKGTCEEFLRALDAQLPASFRSLATRAAPGGRHAIERYSRSNTPLSSSTVQFLNVDVEYVNGISATAHTDPKDFYKGHTAGFAPLEQGLDVRRKLGDDLTTEYLIRDQSEKTTGPEVVLIKAHAGAGKSVILRRLAWDAAREYECICLFAKPQGSLNPAALQELVRSLGRRIYLFVDDVADRSRELEALLKRLGPEGDYLTIVMAERINEWNVQAQEAAPFVTDEYELKYLNAAEIDALLALLERHHALGPRLEGLSLDERRKELSEHAGGQLLVALHEATLGIPFETILQDEFNHIAPSEAQRLYLTVCVLNRLNVPVRAGLVARVHGIPFEDFKERFFAPLEHVVFAQYDELTRDFHYRARHPRPNLILLDEVLQYLISVGGIKVHQTTLRDETMNFLHRLTGAVGNSANTALVFSLQSSKRESLEYVNLLQTVDHLAARKDQLREPVEGKEVLSVIQRRLLARIPTAEEATPAANAYQEIITQMKRGYAKGAAEERQAEEEGLALRERIRDAYPFHPALIDVMREQWAAIPDFQRTRGALRFLAACLRATKREEKSRAVLGPGDVPINDAEVRLAFFKEVGQQADFQAVLEHDLIGANARARRIDDRRTKESPSETGKRAAFRLATAILMYSFGGLRRDGANGTQFLPPGITEADLLSVCVGPDLDSTTALACLKELKEQCLYLHFDGARYCFKKDPNVTLLIEQESNAVARDERQVEDHIREMLEARITGRNVVIWKAKSGEIPDKEPNFLIAYMPLDFGTQATTGREAAAKEVFENSGSGPRKYRNGLGLAVPAAEQIEILRRSVRYLIAIERIREKSRQLNLTDEQKSQLKEQEATRTAEAESALLKLYAEVWLPKVTTDGIVIDVVAIGGRPLQTTLNEKKQARVHDRVMELLVDVQRRVFPTVSPSKIIELFKLGEGNPPTLGIKTADVIDGFYSFFGFPRLVDSAAIKKAITRGIHDGLFGYSSGTAPALGSDGKYQVPLNRVRFNTVVGEDEIDMDSGFLMMPQAVPVAATSPASAATGGEVGVPDGQSTATLTPTPGAPGAVPGAAAPAVAARQKSVEINFSADRNHLFTAWNAIANLADLAGKVNVTVRADSAEGFDKSKLQNGVLEPLRESDLIE